MQTTQPAPGPVTNLAISPDNRTLAAADSADLAHLFDLVALDASGTRVRSRTGKSLFFSADGQTLVTVSGDREVSFWDVETAEAVARHSYGGEGIANIARGGDGRYVAVHGFTAVEVLDVKGGKLVRRFGGHTNHVEDVSFAKDDGAVLSVSGDRSAQLWSLSAHPIRPRYGDDAKRALLASGDDRIEVRHHADVMRCCWSSQKGVFATAQADGLIRIWRTGELNDYAVAAPGYDHRAVLSPDGRYFTPVGWWRDRMVRRTRVYDLETGTPVGPVLEAAGYFNGGAFAPHGRSVVTLSSKLTGAGQTHGASLRWEQQPGEIAIWNLTEHEAQPERIETASEPVDAAFSPRGDARVVACANGEILAFDSGTLKATLRHLGRADSNYGWKPVRYVRFSPTGDHFATLGFDSSVRIWDAAALELVHSLKHDFQLRDASFSLQGDLLATASDQEVKIFDVRSGAPVQTLPSHPDWVFSVCFSSDRELLLTSCRDRMARLWNWKTPELACAPFEHDDEVFFAGLTPCGRFAVTAGRDGLVRRWATATGAPVGGGRLARGMVHHVAIDPAGRYAVASGKISTVEVMDLQPLDPAPLAALRSELFSTLAAVVSGRRIKNGGSVNLTSDEWSRYWKRLQAEMPAYRSWAWNPERRRARFENAPPVREKIRPVKRPPRKTGTDE